MKREENAAPHTWLRLSQAADYLGVHPSTLRRWADEGAVHCMRTPGGRRRFAAEELAHFLDRMSAGSTENAMQQMAALLPHSPMASPNGQLILREEPWYGQIDQDRREAFRRQGQKLMSILMHYVTRDDAGQVYLDEAERLASSYAQLLTATGLTLQEAVHAFVLVRQSMTHSLHETGSVEGPPDAATWRLYRRTHEFLDHVLMALVDAYSLAA